MSNAINKVEEFVRDTIDEHVEVLLGEHNARCVLENIVPLAEVAHELIHGEEYREALVGYGSGQWAIQTVLNDYKINIVIAAATSKLMFKALMKHGEEIPRNHDQLYRAFARIIGAKVVGNRDQVGFEWLEGTLTCC